MKKILIAIITWLLISGGIWLGVNWAQGELKREAQRITPPGKQEIVQEKTPEAKPVPTEKPVSSLDVTSSYMLTFVNRARENAGVQPVIELRHISDGAFARAIYLINNNQWSHDGYQDAIRKTLWRPSSASIGEDLARQFENPENVVEAWLKSPKHKEILLNPAYKYCGIGNYNSYWVLWMTDKP